jgi:ABC-2 type transport system ATP-binding protein
MIECHELTHAYGTVEPALNRLTLRVNEGDCFGLIGANGAGKTTALRILSTLLVPTSGTATIGARDVVRDCLQVRQMIGYMPESLPVFMEFTVGEFLSWAAALHGLQGTQCATRVDSVLALTDMAGKRDAWCNSLSQGMRQRLFLARALVHDPAVLLQDEPSSGLDPAARVEFRHIMRELIAAGKTIIVSSHILTELSEFCTSVGIVERGKLVVSGSIADVLNSLGAIQEIDVEVVGDTAAAVQRLRRFTSVTKVVVNGARIAVTVSGAREQHAVLLKALVEAGIPVASFAVRRATLEQIFMKVAAFETN